MAAIVSPQWRIVAFDRLVRLWQRLLAALQLFLHLWFAGFARFCLWVRVFLVTVRGFEKLFTHASCGREPALPAFSTGAHPLKCVGAVSCFVLPFSVSFLVSTPTHAHTLLMK